VTYLIADLRAFGAAIRKEFRIIRRYPLLLFGITFWPILLPSVYVLMGDVFSGGDPRASAAFVERSGVGSVAGFLFVGFAMYMWLSVLLWNAGTSLRQEQIRGTLEAIFLTPASRLVLLFGPPLAHLYTIGLSFLIMAIGLRLMFGVELGIDAVLRAIVVILVAVPAMYAISSLFASSVMRYGETSPAVQVVRGTLVLLSGVSFPLVMLPDWAQAVAAVTPTTYIVDDVRRVLLGGAGLDTIARDLAITLLLAAVLTAFAVVVYRWNERAARRTGMLGRY
jgi:ABC-2 type transport system permease protein